MKKELCNYFLIIFLTHYSNCFCQALDPTFGTGGKVTTDFSMNSNDQLNAMALQSDGKIVTAGSCGMGFALVRYDNSGALDLTFGTGGKTLTNYGIYNDVPNAVALQSDGKILAAGFTYLTQYNQDILITRYNSLGGQDLLFGTNGAVILDVANGADIAYSITLQSDGKILVGGTSENSQHHSCFLLLRLNSDGSLDTGFGNNGIVSTCTNNLYYCTSMVLENDGKIILGGGTLGGNDFALARYLNNGNLDSTFGTSGITLTNFGGMDAICSLALQSDGKIVAGGFAEQAAIGDFAFARYNNDGLLDQTFAIGGKGRLAVSSANDYCLATAIQSDGRILLAGWSLPPTPSYADITLVRLNSNGSLDSTFDTDGIVTTDFRNSPDGATAIAIQADGKIVVGGMSSNPASYNQAEGDFALARYENNAVAVKKNTLKNELMIYPNPASGVFTVSFFSAQAEAITLRITDALGHILYKETIRTFNGIYKGDVDLGKQAKGIYFVEILEGNKRTVRKIVLE